jgi:type II secretory pathway pseudopilin PulG
MRFQSNMNKVATPKYKAFTMIEIIVIVGLIAIMAVSGATALFNYYRISIMDVELRSVTARLQRARQLAISNDSSSPYSVKFFADRYVIFKGAVYTEGAVGNDPYPLTTNVLVSTTYTNEIITFNNFTGRTGALGSITLTAFDLNRTITINSLGIVEDVT